MRRYAVIYADPPWRYSSKHHGFGGAEDHYSTMALEDIKAIRVPASDDCALFLWATMPLLQQAFEVIDGWGFKYKTTAFGWVKQNKSGAGLVTGLGYWTRSNVEVCLLATRGRPRPKSHGVHSVVVAPRRRHSQKPDEVRDRIVELMGNVTRLEMFARTRTPGWDVWGNEVKGAIELSPGQPLSQRVGEDDSERRWRRCSTAS
jgi:site-specific DNA-methyltransferase (adenine-specific)